MHSDPWQIFADNGEVIDGQSAPREEFDANQDLVMGASHVWIWRKRNGQVEVLLQKRSASLKSWPGYYDISAAGHIDAGESPVESAVREAKEEIGFTIEPDKLFFILSLRTPLDKREIDFVFLYEQTEDTEFHFDDGEVEALEWVGLDEFKKRVATPEEYHLVPQGKEYFSLLLMNLNHVNQ